VELLPLVVDRCGPTCQYAHWHLAVWGKLLNRQDLFLVVLNSLKDAVHTGRNHDFGSNSFHFSRLLFFLVHIFLLVCFLVLQELLHVDIVDLSVLDRVFDVLVGQVDQHVTYFLHQEGDTPFEEVHLLGQVERVHDVFILFNVHFIVLYQDNCSLVVIFAAIIWRAENCDYGWERLVAAPTVHFVAIDLDLMGTDDGDEVVLTQNFFHGVQTELDRALSLHILAETEFAGFSVLHRV